MVWLALLFLVVPIAELVVIVQVAGAIGIPETIALLIVISAIGAWLVKREGLGVIRRLQSQLDEFRLPHRELVDGFLILFAGALMLTPGFLTDCLAVLLLLPPTRAVCRGVVLSALRRRSSVFVVAGGRTGPGSSGVHDVSATDVTDRQPRPPQAQTELDRP
jgi:UPF0716 protein FxsA